MTSFTFICQFLPHVNSSCVHIAFFCACALKRARHWRAGLTCPDTRWGFEDKVLFFGWGNKLWWHLVHHRHVTGKIVLSRLHPSLKTCLGCFNAVWLPQRRQYMTKCFVVFSLYSSCVRITFKFKGHGGLSVPHIILHYLLTGWLCNCHWLQLWAAHNQFRLPKYVYEHGAGAWSHFLGLCYWMVGMDSYAPNHPKGIQEWLYHAKTLIGTKRVRL